MDNPEVWFFSAPNILQIDKFSGVRGKVERKQEGNGKTPEGGRWKGGNCFVRAGKFRNVLLIQFIPLSLSLSLYIMPRCKNNYAKRLKWRGLNSHKIKSALKLKPSESIKLESREGAKSELR